MENGKQTKDDVRNGLLVAKEHEFKSIAIIALGLRLPRCEVTMEMVLNEKPELGGISAHFLAAEVIISKLALRKGRLKQWGKFWENFETSKPYQRTYEDEKAGFNALLKDLKEGTRTYQGTGKS